MTDHPRPRVEVAAPSAGEIAEGTLGALSALAIGTPLLPGFLLTVPGLVAILLPVIALGLLAAAVGLALTVAAVPVLVGRLVVRRARHALAGVRLPRLATSHVASQRMTGSPAR